MSNLKHIGFLKYFYLVNLEISRVFLQKSLRFFNLPLLFLFVACRLLPLPAPPSLSHLSFSLSFFFSPFLLLSSFLLWMKGDETEVEARVKRRKWGRVCRGWGNAGGLGWWSVELGWLEARREAT